MLRKHQQMKHLTNMKTENRRTGKLDIKAKQVVTRILLPITMLPVTNDKHPHNLGFLPLARANHEGSSEYGLGCKVGII